MAEDNEFLAELQEGFLQEASDLLVSAEECFLRLEQNPKSQADLDQLFRVFHNLKGSSAAVEFAGLSKFCHSIENLLVPIKNGKVLLSGEYIEVLLRANDRVKAMIEALKKNRASVIDCSDLVQVLETLARGGASAPTGARPVAPSVAPPVAEAPVDPNLLQDFFSDATDQLEAMDHNLLVLEKDWHNQEALNALFRAFHTMKSASAILGLSPLEKLAHAVEDVLDRMRNGELPASERVVNPCFEAINFVRGSVTELKNTGKISLTPDDPGLQALCAKVSDLKATGASSQNEPPETAGAPAQQGAAGASSTVKEGVKVDADRLDRLVDTIGELVIAEAMISQAPELRNFRSNDQITRHMSQLNKITRVLQEIGMSLRMVPVRPTFRKMSRIVRDVSKKLGKEVNLELFGEETELEKTVADKIGDPLVHMIRNAVDHGIERNVEDRIKAGKPAAGRVSLKAFHKSGNIWIEIQDDGRGLDKDVLLAKGRERGLVKDGQYLPDSEIYNLIFLPGFSTAEKVTDVSGRGVGMDVVRRNIEEIRGQVDIKSELGKGTTFTIRIPNTLAIVEGMVILVGKERYVVPTYSIIRSLKVGSKDLVTVSGEKGEMVREAEKLRPLIRLSEVFGVPGAEQDPTRALVLIVEDEGQQAAFLIDRILKQQQFVIKNLGDFLKGTPGISGGTIMPDGDVGLILDIGAIIKAKSIRPALASDTAHLRDSRAPVALN